MNILSIFALFSAVFALVQGIYVIILNPRSRLHLLFLGITLCLAQWSLCAMFGFSAPDLETINFWLRASSPGISFHHALTLHFVLEISGYSKKIPKSLIIALYLPSVFFCWYGMTHQFVFTTFIRTGSFWTGVPMLDSPVFLAFMGQYLFYYVISAVLLLNWVRNSNSNRLKIQGRIMFASIVFTILIYNIEPFLLPYITEYRTLVISVNAGILWVTGFWIAIIRYRLFTWEKYHVIRDIFDSIEQSVLLLDPDLHILAGNHRSAGILKIAYESLPGKKAVDYIDGIVEIVTVREENSSRVLFFKVTDAEGGIHTFRYLVSPMRDTYGDFYGYLLAGNIIPGFDQLMNDYNLTGRELSIVRHIANGLTGKDIAAAECIALTTVKSHLTHIYNKTGTNNHMELLRLLAGYENRTGELATFFSN